MKVVEEYPEIDDTSVTEADPFLEALKPKLRGEVIVGVRSIANDPEVSARNRLEAYRILGGWVGLDTSGTPKAPTVGRRYIEFTDPSEALRLLREGRNPPPEETE